MVVGVLGFRWICTGSDQRSGSMATAAGSSSGRSMVRMMVPRISGKRKEMVVELGERWA